jgi:hypothetical protein
MLAGTPTNLGAIELQQRPDCIASPIGRRFGFDLSLLKNLFGLGEWARI